MFLSAVSLGFFLALDFRGGLGGKVGSACEVSLGFFLALDFRGGLGGKVGSACEEFEDSEGDILG